MLEFYREEEEFSAEKIFDKMQERKIAVKDVERE